MYISKLVLIIFSLLKRFQQMDIYIMKYIHFFIKFGMGCKIAKAGDLLSIRYLDYYNVIIKNLDNRNN